LDCLKKRNGSDHNSHSMEPWCLLFPSPTSPHPQKTHKPIRIRRWRIPHPNFFLRLGFPNAPRNRRGRRPHVKLRLNMLIKPRETTVSMLIKPSFHPVTNRHTYRVPVDRSIPMTPTCVRVHMNHTVVAAGWAECRGQPLTDPNPGTISYTSDFF
jgi:hypothetical protein